MASSRVTLAGHPALLTHIDTDRLSVHTPLRLCPGREMKMRVGRAKPLAVTVVKASIVSLEPRPMYQVELVEAAGGNKQASHARETVTENAGDQSHQREGVSGRGKRLRRRPAGKNESRT